MKPYTLQDLEDVVTDILENSDETTTKTVKEVLRARGFWAEQDGVSRDMDNLAQLGTLTHDDGVNGRGYRFYTLPLSQPVATPVTQPTTPVTQPTVTASLKNWFAKLTN